MRLRCEFRTDRIPVGYQMMFVSLIKQAIQNADKDYCTNIFQYEGKTNKKSKNYAWSVYLKDFEKKEDEFIINGSVIFNVSTPDYEFFINLYNGLLSQKEFEYKEFILNKVKISMEKEKSIDSGKKLFTTLSPIYIQDSSKAALDVEDEKFAKELNYIVDLSLKNYRGYGLRKALGFYPIAMKKKVVKQEIKAFTKNTDKKYHFVNSFAGEFVLEGDVADLRDIYNLGLGFKRGQGFGMIEVV